MCTQAYTHAGTRTLPGVVLADVTVPCSQTTNPMQPCVMDSGAARAQLHSNSLQNVRPSARACAADTRMHACIHDWQGAAAAPSSLRAPAQPQQAKSHAAKAAKPQPAQPRKKPQQVRRMGGRHAAF